MSKRHSKLSRQAVAALIAKIRRGDKAARDELFNANYGLLETVARQTAMRCNLDFDDAVQNGTFGLMKACDKFKPETGHEFSTYAYWCIRSAVTDLARRRAIHQQQDACRIVPPDRRRPRKEVEDLDGDEVRRDDGADAHGDGQEAVDNAETVEDLLQDLTPSEYACVSLHFGLEDACPMSFAQIADILGCGLVEVKRLVAAALERLRSINPGLVLGPVEAAKFNRKARAA